MKKIKVLYNRIRTDSRFINRMMIITVIAALFIMVTSVQNANRNGSLLVDGDGNVVAIRRKDISKSEEYYLTLRIDTQGEISERDVKINKKAVSDFKEQNTKTDFDTAKAEREAEINGVINDIELSDRKKIALPNRLSDGSRLYWYSAERKDYSLLFIALVYVILTGFALKNSLDRENIESRDLRIAVIRDLPRFTNQLMLMLNAGLILSDAFDRICCSYELSSGFDENIFERKMVEIRNKNRNNRRSTASLLNEFAVETDVKELIRVATILTENEKRGSDVIDNLGRESRYLWDNRIIVAREKGKMIDTKLSYPLGILLILLIVITMAPALLNM